MPPIPFELDPVAARVCRLLLTFVFAQAVLHKLRAPSRFLGVLREYRIVPLPLLWPAAGLIVAVELATALGMLLPEVARLACASAGGLLGAYAFAIALNLARGRAQIDCGCTWGAGEQRLSGWLIVRNALLLVAALIGLVAQSERALSAVDLLTILFASSGLALLYLGFGALIANQPAVAALRRSNA